MVMDTNINTIIANVCELEGLLLALNRHGDNLPLDTLEHLKRKARDIDDAVQQITLGAPDAPVTVEIELPPQEEEPAPPVEEPVIDDPEPQEEPSAPQDAPAQDEAPAPQETPDDTLRLSDKLHRHISKDLRRALSLNDRFLFSRELFAGSQERLNEALDRIGRMNTLDEAEHYCYETLALDPNSDTVAAFMNLVKNHFL